MSNRPYRRASRLLLAAVTLAMNVALAQTNTESNEESWLTGVTRLATEPPLTVDRYQKGARSARGMPNFDQVISEKDAQAIQAFVINASATTAKGPSSGPAASVQTSTRRMIAGCEAYALEKKLTPLSIAVVDESGALIEFSRQAGASAITGEAALLKAKTAAKVQVPTNVLTKVAADDPATRDFFALLQLATLPGGWPFADADGKVRGAVGVSGALPEDDSACAQRAAESNR